MLTRELYLSFHLFRQKVIISIQVLHPLPTRQLHQAIARNVASAVGAGFATNSTIVLADNVYAAVGRPVVDDDDLFVGPRLRQGAFDCLSDPVLRVVAGYED
jgi:hypothetical protein